ncbi:MAG: hypothetical protein LJE95_11985 [Acidobacteria bacterium]|nr:hypothetical protein [Acidobacteriota bacterium]
MTIARRIADALMRDRRRLAAALMIAAFIPIGVYLTRHSSGQPAVSWMNIYAPQDFTSASSLWRFLRDLGVPIPPVIATAEILDVLHTGNATFVTGFLYRAALVGVYVVAILLSGPSPPRMAAAFLLSILFLWATTIVHRGNPQTYDIFFPLFVLLFVALLLLGSKAESRTRTACLLVSSGFFLSMAELARPFFLFLLPLPLAYAYFLLRRKGRRSLLWVLAPVLLLSGSWHAYILAAHGQVTWTNHGGFNLYHVWKDEPEFQVPKLVNEIHAAPLAPGRWANLNTPEHTENSRRLARAVAGYVLRHPVRSAVHVLQRFGEVVVNVPTRTYGYNPQDAILEPYRLLVQICFALSLCGAALILGGMLRDRKRIPSLLGSPDVLLVLVGLATLTVLTVGERYEEARFLVTVLPFWAAVPLPRLRWISSGSTRASSSPSS